jgi:uncharacterized protein
LFKRLLEEKSTSSPEFELLCKRAYVDDKYAQYYLGAYFEKCAIGSGRDNSDIAAAVKWYQKASQNGHCLAQYELGILLLSGTRVEKDETTALSWLRRAADQRHCPALLQLGRYYACRRGTENSEAIAVEFYRLAAEKHENAEAQFLLGKCFFDGVGVAVNVEEAVIWYQKAALQQHAAAQYELGQCYYEGKGVGKDEIKAVEFFERAAAQNNAYAQCRMGNIFMSKNLPEAALDSYKKAAENTIDPSAEAQLKFGEAIADQSPELAVTWYTKSAEQGHRDAIWKLFICYKRGLGVKQDETKAAEYLKLFRKEKL